MSRQAAGLQCEEDVVAGWWRTEEFREILKCRGMVGGREVKSQAKSKRVILKQTSKALWIGKVDERAVMTRVATRKRSFVATDNGY